MASPCADCRHARLRPQVAGGRPGVSGGPAPTRHRDRGRCLNPAAVVWRERLLLDGELDDNSRPLPEGMSCEFFAGREAGVSVGG